MVSFNIRHYLLVTNTSVSIANAFICVKYIYARCGKPHLLSEVYLPFYLLTILIIAAKSSCPSPTKSPIVAGLLALGPLLRH